MSLVGCISPARTPRNCVDTSLAVPVTPVAVAMTPNSSSCVTVSSDASGTTAPIAAANCGKFVCPSSTVLNARSAAFCTASAVTSL